MVARQKAVLALIRGGCSQGEAVRRARISPGALQTWCRDPGFSEALVLAAKDGTSYIGDRLDGLLPKAVDVLDAAMSLEDPKQVREMAVRLDAAKTLLRGRGKLKDSSEFSGPGGRPLAGNVTQYQILISASRSEQTDAGKPPTVVEGELAKDS